MSSKIFSDLQMISWQASDVGVELLHNEMIVFRRLCVWSLRRPKSRLVYSLAFFRTVLWSRSIFPYSFLLASASAPALTASLQLYSDLYLKRSFQTKRCSSARPRWVWVLSEPLQDNQNVSEYKSSGYTIVLEDDVRIDTDDLQSEVSKIIKSIEEFDIVFFGNLKENHGQHWKTIYIMYTHSLLFGELMLIWSATAT